MSDVQVNYFDLTAIASAVTSINSRVNQVSNQVKGEMTIARNVTTVGGYGVIEKDPKTEMSKRTISMPNALTNLLKEYKEWQKEFKECIGDKWIESPKVFTAEFGGTIYPGNVLSWLNKETERAGLPHTTIHSLRHTNITMQIMAGVPLVTVSGRAGHARTSTTTDVYSHFLKSSDKQAADKLNEIFE